MINETTPLPKNLATISIKEINKSSTLQDESTPNTSEALAIPNIISGIENSKDVSNSHHGIKFQALSIATVAAFLFMSNVGWISLNQVLCAELLPREIHRSANILIVSFSFLSAFVSIKMFADLVQSLDAGHTFYLFGGINYEALF